MTKKETFKKLILDFFQRSFPKLKARRIKIPLDIDKVIALVGPRRSGKTSILLNIVQELRKSIPRERIVYFNFEDDRIYPLELSDLDHLLNAYYEIYPTHRQQLVYFLFDEIQEVPNWEKFIRRLLDTEHCRIFITGSSAKMLSREIATALRGRTITFEVFPLSFLEYLDFKEIEDRSYSTQSQTILLHTLDKWLQQGGFPELINLPEYLHRQTLQEYFDLMLYRDLSERFSLRHPALLKYILRYVVENIAVPFSANKLYNSLRSQGYKVGKNTVYDYLSYLQEAFLTFQVQIWHRSLRVREVNPKKMYLIDTGFKNLMSIGTDWERLLENAVFLHLRRKGHALSYVQTEQEVDFYWSGGEPTNVCWDMSAPSTRKREINGLLKALEHLDLSSGRILTRDYGEQLTIDGKHIYIQPVWQYFLEEQAS